MKLRKPLKKFIKGVLLPTLGPPLSEAIYSPIVHIRNFLYDKGLLPQKLYPSAKIISIGNLTVGGTGKTPFTISLSNILSSKGFRVGIISRGYGREGREEVVVSTGKGPLVSPQTAGDEPYLIATRTQNVPVIVNRNRVLAAKKLIHQYKCKVIIADDCFQHRKLQRDMDIILWDSTIDPKKESLLPAGRLREPILAVRRAHILILTNSELTANYSEYAAIFKRINKKLVISKISKEFLQVYSLPKRDVVEISSLKNETILAFCGIGNPEQFFSFVKKLLNPTGLITQVFPDHHKYSIKDIELIKQRAAEKNCRHIITTEKDSINMPGAPHSSGVLVLQMNININEGVIRFIENTLRH
ncbi:MAG: tetraacyldisaccharide 4'-kinase [Candidatus Marinimicrobia bacterium]|nr:tetraacyldisaccharide 4'-kinase [Candidatus Neomarinimicrobiota bacterium]